MLLALAILLAGSLKASGAAPLQPSLRDYIHTAWTQHDGIPLSAIGSIVQTTDGYLWLLTRQEGLVRFDGVRFVPQPVPCPRIDTEQSDGAGGLWLACGAQFLHRDPSGLIKAEKRQVLPAAYKRPEAGVFVDHLISTACGPGRNR